MSKTFRAWYNSKLEAFPLLTKCLTAAALNMGGDMICQKIEKSKSTTLTIAAYNPEKEYSVKRTAQFGLVGFAFVAPMLHLNYTKILPTLVPEGTKHMALKKLAFD